MLNKRSISLIGINTIGTLISFFISYFISNNHGSSATGKYYSTLANITLFSIFISFGDVKNKLRDFSVNDKDIFLSRLILKSTHNSFSIRFIILFSISILVYFFFDLENDLILAIVTAFFLSSIQLYSSFLIGNNRQLSSSVLINVTLSGIFFSILITGTIFSSKDYIDFVTVFFISYLIIYVILYASIIDLRFNRTHFIPDKDSIYTTFIIILYFIVNWSNTYIIGVFSTSHYIGVFNIVLKLTLFTSIINNAASSIYSPIYAKENASIGNATISNARFCFLLGIISLSPLFFFGTYILEIFGNEFKEGITCLYIITGSKLYSLIFGTSGQFLIMKKKNKLLFTSVLAGAIAQVSSGLLLIPIQPITGAGFSIMCGTFIEETLKFYFVKKHFGIYCFAFCKKTSL